MSEIEFRFSRRAAVLASILAPLVALCMALLGVLMLLLVWFAALPLSVHDRTALLFILPLFVLFFLQIALSLLIGRETFFTAFYITAAGVTIENRRYGQLQLGWHDITRAHYSRLQRCIVLRSPRLRRPLRIVSTMRERTAGAMLRTACAVLRQHLGERWSERWW